MTQLHFTRNPDEVQSIIESAVEDTAAKKILTTIFNQLMEKQRDEYIQVDDYEQSQKRKSQRNGYYERDYTIRVGTLHLKVISHRQFLSAINGMKRRYLLSC